MKINVFFFHNGNTYDDGTFIVMDQRQRMTSLHYMITYFNTLLEVSCDSEMTV